MNKKIITMVISLLLAFPVFAAYPNSFQTWSEFQSWLFGSTTPQELVVESEYACKNASVEPHNLSYGRFVRMDYLLYGTNSTGSTRQHGNHAPDTTGDTPSPAW